jgi:hypothetical protein
MVIGCIGVFNRHCGLHVGLVGAFYDALMAWDGAAHVCRGGEPSWLSF